MKKIIVLLGILVLLNACASDIGIYRAYRGPKQADSAIAKIYVPSDVNVVRVDEKSRSTLIPINNITELHVLPGAHKITLQYNAIWDTSREGHTRITSGPVAKWLTVKAGGEYRVEHDSPKSLKAAETYASNFDFQIRRLGAPAGAKTDVTAGGRAVAASIAAAPIGAPGLQTSSTPNTTAKMENRAPDSAITRNQSESAARPPLDELKYWWGQASDTERQGFRQWIQSP